MLEEEKKKGNLDYKAVIEEIAPPPELVKDIVTITASSLTILKILYDFYKETKKRKGKIIIKVNGDAFDLEAYKIEELEVKISKSKENEKS
ncbi:MAG: hypothetical protein ACKD6O_08225 [Candidatus Bathyarchaeota archaeon]